MSPHPENPRDPHPVPAMARVRATRFSILWAIPAVAIGISGWLAYRHFSAQGPQISISFDTANGIVPGQTQVKDRAVPLGVVDNVTLSRDLRRAIVKVRMNASIAPYLNDRARFWVVRPQINGASVTGLDTLISGAYIAMDPGPRSRSIQDLKLHYTGLENPPGLRSDQPGSVFWLLSPDLGSIGSGAPVFYRDLPVGEVLGYTMPPGGVGSIVLQIFVRAPYDRYLKADSRFWNVSGVQVGFGAGGLKVHLQSLQALFSGGVAFGGPVSKVAPGTAPSPPAAPNSLFWLYESQAAAENTRYRERFRILTYVDSPIGGLAPGSEVTMFGLQVGVVTGIAPEILDSSHKPRLRIDMVLEPGRVTAEHFGPVTIREGQKALEGLIARGMTASVQDVSLLTGQSMVALGFRRTGGKPAPVQYENGVAIVPGQVGGMEGLMQSASSIADQISRMPLKEIGVNLNHLLAHMDQRVNGPEVTRSLQALRGSLQALNQLLDHADEHLPELMTNLSGTLANARKVLGHLGNNGDFGRNLDALVVQLGGTARSLRLLLNYLDHHPSAVITGRH